MRNVNALSTSREHLTLQASRRMAWDTCRLSIETIKLTEITRTSFVSMNSTFRALLCVIDDHTGSSEHEETEQLLSKLRFFCQRWAVGGKSHESHNPMTRLTCLDRYLMRMEMAFSCDGDTADRDEIKASSNGSSTMSIDT